MAQKVTCRIGLLGTMSGHTDCVTAIATPADMNSDMIVTSSCDESIIVWSFPKEDRAHLNGVPQQRLTGHSDSVHDVALSSDGKFALSGSSDNELRLWDLHTGTTVQRFAGHTDGVLSVAFSPDDRQIVSASRDNTIKVWNTKGECKHTFQEAHTDWVSCVRFCPTNINTTFPATIVSGSCDSTIKIWNTRKYKNKGTLTGHDKSVNAVAVSPCCSIMATGGDDGVIMVWDFSLEKILHSWDVRSAVHALCFCPNKYWLCAATEESIQILYLETHDAFADLRTNHACTSLNWSADGSRLFGGYTDGVVRVWGADHEVKKTDDKLRYSFGFDFKLRYSKSAMDEEDHDEFDEEKPIDDARMEQLLETQRIYGKKTRNRHRRFWS